MSATKLPRSFYVRSTLEVAYDLLGKVLVRRLNRRVMAGKIVETEAYVGPHDLACHASKGHTPRTSIMFGQAGHAYLFRCRSTDNAGNTNLYPANAQATTRIDLTAQPQTTWWNAGYGLRRPRRIRDLLVCP